MTFNFQHPAYLNGKKAGATGLPLSARPVTRNRSWMHQWEAGWCVGHELRSEVELATIDPTGQRAAYNLKA